VRDLWGQLDLIEPFCWGSYRHFAFRYCDARPGLYGGLDDKGMSNQAELSTRLSHVVHSIPGAVTRASLPAKRRETWYIPESEQIKPTGGWQTAIKNAQRLGASAMLEIRLAMAASSKRPAVVARVAEHMESGHKVVIFTARQRDCDELRDALLKLTGKSAPAKVWSGHGGNDQDERYAMLQAYISHPGPCVLVGTGAAWGTAIDGLQCTDAAIFALLPYTPGDLNQWEGRFTRLGQDRPVTIYYPIAEGTADEHLASILLDKLPAVDSLAPDDSLDGAAEALAGEVTDSETFAAKVLSKINDEDEF
jgi:superfamily II DNA/RNA helicase